MLTPRGSSEYDGPHGADRAGVARDVQNGAIFLEARYVEDPALHAMIDAQWTDHQRGEEARLPEAPPVEAEIGTLIDWCAGVLDGGVSGWRLGRVAGAVREAYLHGGWAVAAATLAAGDLADRMPAWEPLVLACSARAALRFVGDLAHSLGGHPRPDLLEALGWPAPGEAVVRGALAQLAEALSLQAKAPEGAGLVPARARFDHAMSTAGAMLAGAPLPMPLAAAVIDPSEAIAWIESELQAPWTWAHVEAWRTDDPLAAGKAIVRTAGIAAVDALEDVRVAAARELGALAVAAWQTALVEAQAREQDRLRPIAGGAPLALVEAIDSFAFGAAAQAGMWIAEAVRTGGGVRPLLEELLDPRARPALWSDAAPAIRACLEAP